MNVSRMRDLSRCLKVLRKRAIGKTSSACASSSTERVGRSAASRCWKLAGRRALGSRQAVLANSTAVILRCSPFLGRASKDRHERRACGYPSRRRASARLLRMTEVEKKFMNISRAGSKNDALRIGSTTIELPALANAKRNRVRTQPPGTLRTLRLKRCSRP